MQVDNQHPIKYEPDKEDRKKNINHQQASFKEIANRIKSLINFQNQPLPSMKAVG